MAIRYIHPPTGDQVSKESWRWVAVYKDGTTLEQFEIKEGQAIFHRFAEIDVPQVAEFRLEHDVQKPIIMYPPEGAKLIHAYTIRRAQHLTSDGQFAYEDTYKGFKFGFEKDGVTTAVFVDSDNTIYLTNNLESMTVARNKI